MTKKILRTTPEHPDYKSLIIELDKILAVFDGEDHAFYNQFNSSDVIPYAILAYTQQNDCVGCGALKPYDDETIEIKRMFVQEAYRNQNFALAIITALENWAVELGFKKIVLETGVNQIAARKLYAKAGYNIIPNYPPYHGVEASYCFGKSVR